MPLADVTKGMTGTGISVVEGTDPEAFDVEVLGVLQDAIGPGRDIIIANLSGPVIDAAGGLWAGASGSPVYFPDAVTGDQELAGAVAYGLAGGQSTLAGLTPAEDMDALLDSGGAGFAAAKTVRVPRTLAARAARVTGLAASSIQGFVRLKTPLSVSGVNPRTLSRIQEAIERQDLPLIPYAGASVSLAGPGPTVPLAAGESFAAALSLGDVTEAAVGTTTLVCDGRAVAFGHPFTFSGDTTMAARAADTITIVQDPIFGSYKLANIAENAGVVTGDHLAGIVAELGDGPDATPITSQVDDLDTGASRAGETDVVFPDGFPFLVFAHLLSNIDVTIDRIGKGNAEVAYTITGTRADDSPWELVRTNHYASPFDISFESVLEPAITTEILASYRDEGIEITGMDVSQVDVEKTFEQYSLSKVLVWNGRAYVKRDFIAKRPGQTIRLRAVLTPKHAGGTTQLVDLPLKVPTWVRNGGFIEVQGGLSGGLEIPCFFEGDEGCEDGEGATFDKVLKAFQKQPRNDLVFARLRIGPSGSIRAHAEEQQDAVVSGARLIGFEILR
jgi:hypothetical protein